MTPKPGLSGRIARVPLLVIILCIGLVGLLAGASIWVLGSSTFHGKQGDTSPTPTQPTAAVTKGAQAGGPISPLLFGTNMSLFDSNDQVLNSASTRALLQQMHARIIRMPIRSSLSETTEVQAAQIIKSLGAVPLVVLRGEVDKNVLADDTRVINDMNLIFGKSIVYYEYGNEEDLLGVHVDSYTASWNAIIPQLKRIAINGHFIGPVNYQYDRNYLVTFLQQAKPRPDEISWHEYTCDDSWAPDVCISHIDHWTNHIRDARATMTAVIGIALPIMITEWNYAPNAHPNDGKNNNSTFMHTWTTQALQTLAANRIFAAMQYSCTNTAISLISTSGAPTTQGAVFQAQYQQVVMGWG